MAKEIIQQERSIYETPKVEVMTFSALDIVCLSKENGEEDNGAWWD